MQSLFISILSGAGVIQTIEDSKNLQNFLIACEMLPASIFMLWAFPYTDYKTSGKLVRSCFFIGSYTHGCQHRLHAALTCSTNVMGEADAVRNIHSLQIECLISILLSSAFCRFFAHCPVLANL